MLGPRHRENQALRVDIGMLIVTNNSLCENPSLTTCFLMGALGWGLGGIGMSRHVVVVDVTRKKFFDYTRTTRSIL